MRKVLFVLGLGGLLCVTSAQAAMSVWLSQNAWSAGTGGEFNAVPSGFNPLAAYSPKAIVGGGFETFCIEETEYFAPPASYNVALNSGAVSGCVNLGHGSPIVAGFDPLSLGTCWLYSQFARGILANYDYNNVTAGGRNGSAANLQATIWWLEDEAAAPAAANPFYQAVIAQFANPQADAPVGGTYGVQAMNLTGGPPGYGLNQDMLVVPEPTTLLAGALLLLPFGASTLRILRRKS
jgi:hypothetical protein